MHIDIKQHLVGKLEVPFQLFTSRATCPNLPLQIKSCLHFYSTLTEDRSTAGAAAGAGAGSGAGAGAGSAFLAGALGSFLGAIFA